MMKPVLRALCALSLLWALPAAYAADDATHADVDYEIGTGDRIDIVVFGEDRHSGQFVVQPDGAVDIPVVRMVSLSGLTELEAAAQLTTVLRDGYLVDPHVTVKVSGFFSQRVNAQGVVKPGDYFLNGRTTLQDLINEAGGVPKGEGSREIVVTQTDGEQTRVPLDQLQETGEPNPVLVPGDKIRVLDGQNVHVAGEVVKPGSQPWVDSMTVTQAYLRAGGARETGSLKGAYILRSDEQIPVNLRKVLKGKESDLAMLPGDKLVLKESVF